MKPILKTIALFTVAGISLTAALAARPSPDAPEAPTPPIPPVAPIPANIGPPQVPVAPTPPLPPAVIKAPTKNPPKAPKHTRRVTKSEDNLVQIALLLDTSGSMSGLIDQARTQLWNVVNQLAEARRRGKQPILEIAVYDYGNGFPRQVTPFSRELDQVSEALFSLAISGGTENCGETIDASIANLNWSKDPQALKMIFIAGNEPFTQGPVDPYKAVKRALGKNITVNTIYCGSDGSRDAKGWQNGAVLADGRFLAINHNQKVVHIPAPQDQKIGQLGVELNRTYIPFGVNGRSGSMRQRAEDNNAMSSGISSYVRRGVSKSSSLYRNTSWELVDALKEKKVKIEELEAKDLPEEMKNLNAQERVAFVATKQAERSKIQQEIKRLTGERQKFVAAKRAAQGNDNSLDVAMNRSVRQLASKRGYKFE